MITITNNNIYHSDFSLSSFINLENVDVIDIDKISYFLSDFVELGESVTFKRLFEIVSNNVIKFDEIFYSSLGGYSLMPFLQEIENNPTETIESDIIEFYWHCDKYEDEIFIVPSMHGISSSKKGDDNKYALDFVSLNNLKECIVKINKKVNILNYDNDKINTLNLGDKFFTLFELFNAILYEISFYGGPQDKKEKFEDLEETISKIDMEEIKSSESFENIIERLENDDIYLVKYKEKRDRVDESRITNSKNLSKLKKCLEKKLEIFEKIENSIDEDLTKYYKQLTNLEFDMQLLYGENEDISYHNFWLTPKCTCPKIDNLEIYPSKNPIFDKNCPIHKNN